jgi:hypothetical protein
VELSEVTHADAIRWLEGGDPIKERSNYKVAKELAQKVAPQNAEATFQRLKRKLAEKPYDRTWHMLVTAERLSASARPFHQHLRVLEKLAMRHPDQKAWSLGLSNALFALECFRANHGKPPSNETTMDEVRKRAWPSSSIYAEAVTAATSGNQPSEGE